jgi:hypothetical protein
MPNHEKVEENKGLNNTLMDLNNFLFGQLERLDDPDCDLDKEIPRSKAMVDIGKVIVENANTALEGAKYISECKGAAAFGGVKRPIPGMLEVRNEE